MSSQVQPASDNEPQQPAAKPRKSKSKIEVVPRQPRYYREKEKGPGNGYRTLNREEIVTKLTEARYQGRENRFLVHAFRLAGGSAVLSGVLYSIFLKTITGYRTKGNPQPEYAPPMRDEDYADELQVTKQAVNEAIREALGRQVKVGDEMVSEPLIERRGTDGGEYYQYRLTIDAWEKYHNGFETRDLTPKDKGEENTNALETVVSRIQFAAGEKKSFQVGEGDTAITLNCRNVSREVGFSIQPTLSQPGQVDLDIAPEQTDSSNTLPKKAPARAPESNRGRVDTSITPSLATRTPAAAGDLIARCKKIGLVVGLELARRTLAELQECPLEFFFDRLSDRVARGKSGQTTVFQVGNLPQFAAEQLIKWKAEASGENGSRPPWSEADKIAAARVERDRRLGRIK